MGLLTGLLTLPLAPVRATAWIAEQLAAEAERQLSDESGIRRDLAQLEASYELGELDERAYREREDELLDRLDMAREQRESLGDDRG